MTTTILLTAGLVLTNLALALTVITQRRQMKRIDLLASANVLTVESLQHFVKVTRMLVEDITSIKEGK